ncbi:hypothetical protein BGW38_009940 [Lunasporangiospora selenospora]|uniref:Uncharacterized protein n=1 Tax=Lunasporangiospora selenospora TaxID=979761 RepID=A0A9P6KFY0_9FUNG|nr:hypothetical protein BGW38_009940 [Lunasporangiospora selenospora]
MGASSWTPLEAFQTLTDTVDDNKLYIFGGGSALGASSGQLYILDVKSRTVAKLGPETEKRAYLACAATQYSFFAWGGLDTSGAPTKTLAPLVFNFASGTWVNSNIIPPPPPPPLPPQVSGTNPNSGNSGNGTGTKPGTGNGNDDGSESGGSQLNIAAIAGGIAGGIAVITLVVIGVYFWHKRRKEQKHDDSSDTPKKLSSKEDHFGGRNRQGSRPSDNESDYDGRRPESLISGYSDEESQFTPVRRKASFPMDKPARYRRMQTPIPGTEPRSLNRGDHNIHNQYDSRVDSMVAEANSNTFDSYDNRSTRNQGHRPSNPEGNRGPQSPHEIQQDRQPNGRRPKTPRPTPTESTSSQNGDTRPTDLQYTTRPRGPQYIAPRPNDPHYWEPDPSDPQYIGPRLNDPQFGVPRPLDLNYGVQTYRDPQFSYENRNNPHSTPRIMAYSSRHNSTFEGAPQHKHSTPTTLKPPPAIPTLDE